MKIGVFDSGFGGLTIFKALRARLPGYDYVYLGDNARTPYGNRSFDAIYRFSAECIHRLFGLGCELIVIACNTASAKALRSIQQRILPERYPGKRVLGIIRPSVEAIAARARSGTVALWATEGTVQSDSYALELAKLAPGLELVQQACPLLVPLVEAGEWDGPGVDHFIAKYWSGTLGRGPRPAQLLLACTHYPLLLPRIRALVPGEVEILVQGEIVAPSLADYLRRHPEIDARLSRGGSQEFFTTDRTEGFDRLAEAFLGYPPQSRRLDL